MPALPATPPDVRNDLRARRLPLTEVTPDDIVRWDRLSRNAAEPNPFFEPACLLPAVRHLGDAGASLLVIEDEQAWRACLPVRTLRLAGRPAGLTTWRHAHCFLGTPLIDACAIAPAARALLGQLLDQAPARHVVLERMAADGPVANALRAAMKEVGLTTVLETVHERALLARRPAGDCPDSLGSHHRRELNRLGRRLQTELGGKRSVADEAGHEDAVDAFLSLERSGWKGRNETALGSAPGHAAFFRELCRGFEAEGRLQLLTLYMGERRVAMKCNLYSGAGGFCFKIAYDDELARCSPGVQLERENMRIFRDERVEPWQDSCADPDNTMINRLWPDRRRFITVVLARGVVRAAFLRQGLNAAQTARTIKRRTASARS